MLAAWGGIEPPTSSGKVLQIRQLVTFTNSRRVYPFQADQSRECGLPFYLTLVHMTQFKGIIRRMFQPIILTARKWDTEFRGIRFLLDPLPEFRLLVFRPYFSSTYYMIIISFNKSYSVSTWSLFIYLHLQPREGYYRWRLRN